MKYILGIIIVILLSLLIRDRIDSEYQRGFADALKSAYKTNPPSDQLEMVCAGLWFGEQYKKYQRK